MPQDPEERKALQLANVMINRVPPHEWGAYLERIGLDAKQQEEFSVISSRLHERAAALVSVAKYLDARGGAGSGDSGHDYALKYSNKETRKVRKALGYSRP